MTSTVASYDFKNASFRVDAPPVLGIAYGDIAEGFHEITDYGLTDQPNIHAMLYQVIEPTYTEPRWFRMDKDLYNTGALYWHDENVTNGTALYWRLDHRVLSPQIGDCYAPLFIITNGAIRKTIEFIVRIEKAE